MSRFSQHAEDRAEQADGDDKQRPGAGGDT